MATQDVLLDFEKPIAELERKLSELQDLSRDEKIDFSRETKVLKSKIDQLTLDTFQNLSAWQKIQLCRHPSRPHTRDYVDLLFPDFMELRGDRAFGEDPALLGGVASWTVGDQAFSCLILGHQKGRTTKLKLERNFGMVKPEGYRKAIRLMQLAERTRMPVITLIDTPGAFPGIEAEERGQAQAIAECIQQMFALTVPSIAIVIGEGGSGGALAIGVANRVLMQQYSSYSVISPESCASILWSDAQLAPRAAEKLKMSAPELLSLGVIDAIVQEPDGGAHRNWSQAAEHLGQAIHTHLDPLITSWMDGKAKSAQTIKMERLDKFRTMGNLALGHAP